MQKKRNLLSTIWNLKVLSLSCSYYEPKNNGIKFGDARHTFSCLVLSYFTSLTQHSLVRPLNPNTCYRSFSYHCSNALCLFVSFFLNPHKAAVSLFPTLPTSEYFGPCRTFVLSISPWFQDQSCHVGDW
uniref:Uncharacterized protein n=1 Tax=Gorilla gorilla gorilla TaxID=9595 RepID=A0A2I2YTM7_GORGO